MIHVADAAAAIAALAAWAEAPGGTRHALADPNPAGYSPREIMAAAAAALGNHPRFVSVPQAALRVAGQAASLWGWLGGDPGVFSAGKAREMAHPDWSVSPEELLPATIARSRIPLAEGFAATAAWYAAAVTSGEGLRPSTGGLSPDPMTLVLRAVAQRAPPAVCPSGLARMRVSANLA